MLLIRWTLTLSFLFVLVGGVRSDPPVTEVVNGIGTTVDSLVDGIDATVTGLADGVDSIVESLVDGVDTAVDEVVQLVGDTFVVCFRREGGCSGPLCAGYLVTSLDQLLQGLTRRVGFLDFSRTRLPRRTVDRLVSAAVLDDLILAGSLVPQTATSGLQFLVSDVFRALPGFKTTKNAHYFLVLNGGKAALDLSLNLSLDLANIEILLNADVRVDLDWLRALLTSSRAIGVGTFLQATATLQISQFYIALPPPINCPSTTVNHTCVRGEVQTFRVDVNLCLHAAGCVSRNRCPYQGNCKQRRCPPGYVSFRFRAPPYGCVLSICIPSFLKVPHLKVL